MANHIKGESTFKIQDKEYTLCFDNEALIQLEDILDQGIVGVCLEMQRWGKEPERIRLKWIRAMLWAGLRQHQPKITLEEAGDIMDAGGGVSMMNVIGEAMSKAWGEQPESKDARPTNGAGTSGIGIEPSLNTAQSDTASKPSGVLPRVN